MRIAYLQLSICKRSVYDFTVTLIWFLRHSDIVSQSQFFVVMYSEHDNVLAISKQYRSDVLVLHGDPFTIQYTVRHYNCS